MLGVLILQAFKTDANIFFLDLKRQNVIQPSTYSLSTFHHVRPSVRPNVN